MRSIYRVPRLLMTLNDLCRLFRCFSCQRAMPA